jgi:hypothetical protein
MGHPMEINALFLALKGRFPVDKPGVCVFCARRQIVPMTTRTR